MHRGQGHNREIAVKDDCLTFRACASLTVFDGRVVKYVRYRR